MINSKEMKQYVVKALKRFEEEVIRYDEGEKHFDFENDLVSISKNEKENLIEIVCVYAEDGKKYTFKMRDIEDKENYFIDKLFTQEGRDISPRKLMCF